MKKKGLIISTIVMVVVLIASLTTATYAWFSNDGSAKVTAINFAVGASADVVIGVAKTNAYKQNATQADFYSDTTTYNAGTNAWSGKSNALGLEVNPNANLSNMQKAVYSFSRSGEGTEQSPYTYAKTAYAKETSGTPAAEINSNVTTGIDLAGATAATPTAYIMKALGSDATTPTAIEAAVRQTDYIDITLGAQAARDEVIAFGCMVYIAPTETKTILGLNAAIHVAYRIDAGSWVEKDVYGALEYGQLKSDMDVPTLPSHTIDTTTKSFTDTNITPVAGDGYVWIPLFEGTSATSNFANYTTKDGIKQLELVIYVCGEDDDCITEATGVGATIYIEFLSINKTQWNQA